MPYPNEHSCRLKSPDLFREPWVRVSRKSTSAGKEYDVIRGTLKKSGKVEDQAYRYKKSSWPAEEARSHCGAHNGTFEPAKSTSAHAKAAANLPYRFINTPLMLDFSKSEAIIHAYEDLDFSAFGFAFLFEEEAEMEINNGIATIPIQDVLSHKKKDVLFSGTSYEKIRENFRKAMSDSSVKHIVFLIDSPGGVVSGAFELAEEIFNAREEKPMTAVVDDTALSAAYLVASATDKIYVAEFGEAGSVGILAVHVDQSSRDNMQGLKYTTITKGAKKANLSPHAPLSQNAYKDIDAKAEKIYEKFINVVARNRGISAESVRLTEAGILQGEEGIKAGFVDAILSKDDFMQTLTSNFNGGMTMETLQEKLKALKEEATPEEWAEEISQLGFVDKSDEVAKLTADCDYLTEMVNAMQAEITTLKEASPDNADMVARIQTLESAVSQSRQELLQAQESKRVMEIKAEIEGIGVLGDADKTARRLFSLEKIDPKLYSEEIEHLTTVANALRNAHIFEEVGSSSPGAGVGGSKNKLMAVVKQKLDSGVSEAEAWKAAARENPQLYRAYREGN